MNKVLLALGLAFVLVLSSSFALVSANDVVISTVPSEIVWKADGVTEYRMDVYADNTELQGETTPGANWQVIKPAGLEDYIEITKAEWPTEENDFFSGFSTFYKYLKADWDVHAKVVNEEGPSVKKGIVASYWFIVKPGFVGETSFDINTRNTKFSDNSGNPQSFRVENTPFTVEGEKKGKELGSDIPIKISLSNAKKCKMFNFC